MKSALRVVAGAAALCVALALAGCQSTGYGGASPTKPNQTTDGSKGTQHSPIKP